eukprot:gnl/MRDRNA2_/MRDRNA2_23519_c0_seq2.p1 gnl/MRDRNA2_/MRDRNA2_23519_c0~~gnl/MRDRNA2_/MRDRNA2_23519_c0_seq2.p1  ORF type:complete len:478 (-),score=75.29 gnl/MRDRNA2_/MRDRNA2_23519_c0_seq2:13-1386(-)
MSSQTKNAQPLHVAALKGHVSVIEWLVTYKVSISAVETRGGTPLHLACQGGHLRAVDLLTSHRANVAVATTQSDASQPMHFAAQDGHADVVEFLAQCRADIAATNGHGDMPIHLAAAYGHTSTLKALATPQSISAKHTGTKHGWQPLHFAAERGHFSVVKELISLRSNVGAAEKHGGQALHIAALHGNAALVELLVHMGASLEAEDNNGNKPKDIATSRGHLQLNQILKALSKTSLVAEKNKKTKHGHVSCNMKTHNPEPARFGPLFFRVKHIIDVICDYVSKPVTLTPAASRWTFRAKQLLEPLEPELDVLLSNTPLEGWDNFYRWLHELTVESEALELFSLGAQIMAQFWWKQEAPRGVLGQNMAILELHRKLPVLSTYVPEALTLWKRAGRFDKSEKFFKELLAFQEGPKIFPWRLFYDSDDFRRASQRCRPGLRSFTQPDAHMLLPGTVGVVI